MLPRTHAFAAAMALAVAGFAAPAALAATTSYAAILNELNGSGVSGRVDFRHDRDAETLRVTANISGLAPSLPHVNHIHGRFNEDGSARNSEVPTTALDADEDGFVEVLEAAPAYGDILLSLESALSMPGADPAMVHTGPAADEFGNLSYDLTFDLSEDGIFFSPVSGADYTAEDIFPLDLREYVIHGAFVPGSTLNEGFSFAEGTERADGTGYSATLPVAAAEISTVPVPAGGLLLLMGLGGIGIAGSRRRRKAS